MPKLKRRCRDRLMLYYMFLCEQTCGVSHENPLRTVTSARIADALEIDHTLVRKDLATIRVRGQSRVGFDAPRICETIRRSLGLDRRYEAVLVGAGHLGGALLAYPGFSAYGLSVAAAFDSDPEKVGGALAGKAIRPMKALRQYLLARPTRLAILTVPRDAAQKVADKLISSGVDVIWNFTTMRLVVPTGVLVRHTYIARGLADIAYYLKDNRTRTWRPH